MMINTDNLQQNVFKQTRDVNFYIPDLPALFKKRASGTARTGRRRYANWTGGRGTELVQVAALSYRRFPGRAAFSDNLT
jgi:hypothetical protein